MWLVSDVMFVIVHVLTALLNWRYAMFGATPFPWLNCACSLVYCIFMLGYAYYNNKSRLGMVVGALQVAGGVILCVISITQADAFLLGLLPILLLVPLTGFGSFVKGTAQTVLILVVCVALLGVRVYRRKQGKGSE